MAELLRYTSNCENGRAL